MGHIWYALKTGWLGAYTGINFQKIRTPKYRTTTGICAEFGHWWEGFQLILIRDIDFMLTEVNLRKDLNNIWEKKFRP
jgi:hypothetical protein